MHAVAVGRLADQHVASLDERRIVQQRQTAAAEVAGEDDAPHFAAVVDFQFNDRRAEDVAGVAEPQPQLGRRLQPFVIRDRLEQPAHLADVLLVVQRLDERIAGRLVLAEITGVFGLDLRGVAEHDGRDVGRGLGAVDRPAKARLPQSRKVAAMVDVRVRKDHRVERLRLAMKALVPDPRLGTMPLKEPAVEQQTQILRLQQMLAAGDLARGA